MNRVAQRVRTFALQLWRYEPVRTALAPLILAAVIASLARAGVDGSLAGVVATVALGALGFTAQEIARAKVTPVAKVPDVTRAQVNAVIGTAAHELGDQLGPETRRAVDVLAAQARQYIGQHRAGR